MKDKWKKLFAFLGIADVQTSADGVFMKEEDIDKFSKLEGDFSALESQNKTLADAHAAEIEKINKENAEAVAAFEAERTEFNEKITSLNASLASANAEIETLKGAPIVVAGTKDPVIQGGAKPVLTPNQAAAVANAKALLED